MSWETGRTHASRRSCECSTLAAVAQAWSNHGPLAPLLQLILVDEHILTRKRQLRLLLRRHGEGGEGGGDGEGGESGEGRDALRLGAERDDGVEGDGGEKSVRHKPEMPHSV